MPIQTIFSLSADQTKKAHTVIEAMKNNNLSMAEFENGPFKLFIVRGGTQEAEDRKNIPESILGPIEYDNEQYLITAK